MFRRHNPAPPLGHTRPPSQIEGSKYYAKQQNLKRRRRVPKPKTTPPPRAPKSRSTLRIRMTKAPIATTDHIHRYHITARAPNNRSNPDIRQPNAYPWLQKQRPQEGTHHRRCRRRLMQRRTLGFRPEHMKEQARKLPSDAFMKRNGARRRRHHCCRLGRHKAFAWNIPSRSSPKSWQPSPTMQTSPPSNQTMASVPARPKGGI